MLILQITSATEQKKEYKNTPSSLYYLSFVEPQYVSNQKILGTPILRFLPLKRFGVPGLTGEKSISE